jgi:hypothetical protein
LFQSTRCRNRNGEGADVIARTLGNENDLLRFQLDDIIAREKNQVTLCVSSLSVVLQFSRAPSLEVFRQ